MIQLKRFINMTSLASSMTCCWFQYLFWTLHYSRTVALYCFLPLDNDIGKRFLKKFRIWLPWPALNVHPQNLQFTRHCRRISFSFAKKWLAYFVSFVLHRASLLHSDEQLFAPETCFGFEGFTVVLQHVQQQYYAGRNTFSYNSDPNSKEITE